MKKIPIRLGRAIHSARVSLAAHAVLAWWGWFWLVGLGCGPHCVMRVECVWLVLDGRSVHWLHMTVTLTLVFVFILPLLPSVNCWRLPASPLGWVFLGTDARRCQGVTSIS